MPRELPELIGEPIGFGLTRITREDERDVLIERAVNISDLCTDLRPNHKMLLLLGTLEGEKQGVVIAETRNDGRALMTLGFTTRPLNQDQKNLLKDVCATYGISLKKFYEAVNNLLLTPRS